MRDCWAVVLLDALLIEGFAENLAQFYDMDDTEILKDLLLCIEENVIGLLHVCLPAVRL